jgi:hypothetical protein
MKSEMPPVGISSDAFAMPCSLAKKVEPASLGEELLWLILDLNLRVSGLFNSRKRDLQGKKMFEIFAFVPVKQMWSERCV